jgi:hypothetical protein
VTAALITRRFAAYPRQNGVAAPLRELGSWDDWSARCSRSVSGPEPRREAGHELNKGEARNSLARAVTTLRQTEYVPDQLLAHLSPLGWEHIRGSGSSGTESSIQPPSGNPARAGYRQLD